MIDHSALQQNHLLAALPAAELTRISEGIVITAMPLGHVLYESGDEMRHVYFPTNCILSLLYVMEDGSSAEIAIGGNEGIVGISLFMGGETTPSRAIVQSAGEAFRVASRILKEEFRRAATLPLAADEFGPSGLERIDHDPGADCQHAGCAARRRHGICRQVTETWTHRVQPRPHPRARPAGTGISRLRVLSGSQDRI